MVSITLLVLTAGNAVVKQRLKHTISAWVGSRLVEVNVNLGMTQCSTSAIAHSNALFDKVNGFFFDELYSSHRVGLL